MVEVDEVLVDELPVALQHARRLAGEAAATLPEETEIGVELGDEIGERCRVLIEVHEHPALPDAEPERAQAAVARVEALDVVHVGRAQELAR